jgi:nucleoside 2-deoxyribosyltransferase
MLGIDTVANGVEMNDKHNKCFVIMPFDPGFDDVYTFTKTSVESAVSMSPINCFRLDERKPAGRITDRLLSELQTATICIADLTGCRPNVMWEVGYAMALQKPIIIVTQN